MSSPACGPCAAHPARSAAASAAAASASAAAAASASASTTAAASAASSSGPPTGSGGAAASASGSTASGSIVACCGACWSSASLACEGTPQSHVGRGQCGRAQSQPEQTTLCRRRCRVQDDSHGRTQDALWEREREIESERAKCLPFRKHSGVAVMQRGRERARAWGRERECEETARAKVQALYDGRTSSVDDDELSRSLVPGDPGGSGSLLLAHGSNGSNGSEPTARD